MKLRLEVFEAETHPRETVVLQASEVEEGRLQFYEKGYTAGYDDAIAAVAATEARLSSELANNLQNLAFTFQEARTHVLRGVQPLLVELATRLLPELAREVVAPVVLDTLMPLIDDASEQPIHLTLNPASRLAVERLLVQSAGLPLQIDEEPTLGEGQVYLRLGTDEYRVDLDNAAGEIIRAVHEFFDYSGKDGEDGQGH